MDKDTRIALQGGVAAIAILAATKTDRRAILGPWRTCRNEQPATYAFEGV